MKWSALLLVAVVFGGCLSGKTDGQDEAERAECAFPNPCGGEWPEGLTGPFDPTPESPEWVEVASHDGTILRGWITRPQLPEGVGAPVILISSPYHGSNTAPPGSGSGGAGDQERYISEGYAVAEFSVRGTGVSGGCFQNKGAGEQADQVVLVEWLADQAWSSGRVAMAGTSYPGTTPIMAAIQGARGLVTILVNGPVTDPYTELHTPQGAAYTMGGVYETGRRGLVSLNPAAALSLPGEGPGSGVEVLSERLCADVADVYLEAGRGHFTDDRDGAFWRERQLIFGMPNITIPVFLSHGLQETAHPFQEDVAWAALPNAPKRMLLGQWDHEYPRVEDWQGQMLGWLDYWLKGLGAPAGAQAPGLGTVTYQDGEGDWHASTSWPPADVVERSYFLDGGALVPHSPHDSAASFRSVAPPPRESTGAPRDHLCGTAPPGTGLVYRTPEGLVQGFGPAVLAGNPYALLQVQSDLPGGIMSLHLYRETMGGSCEDARLLSFGTADLRFHAGGFTGSPFPVGTPTAVRVDLNNMAETMTEGGVLALVVSYGDTVSSDEVADPITDARFSRSGQPYFPNLQIVNDGPGAGGDSFLVIPLAKGSMEGSPVPEQAPARPFTP